MASIMGVRRGRILDLSQCLSQVFKSQVSLRSQELYCIYEELVAAGYRP
jgi:hypothetical protein